MPSAQDQISKLSGTTMIFISMCYLMPSLGINHNSECLTNMAALSIFVVTVVVNICIQIRTGVVFVFIAEHIIVMCCLLILLMLMWGCAFNINAEKDISLETNKGLFAKSQGSMFHGLKLSYLYGYIYNPQVIVICRLMNTSVSGGLCTLCLVLFLQALFKSHRLKFCEGVSDYNWSMWMIVVSQILAIVLGSFSTFCRLYVYTMSNHMKNSGANERVVEAIIGMSSLSYSNNPLSGFLPDVCFCLFQACTMMVTALLTIVFTPLLWLITFIRERCVDCCFKNNLGDVEEYIHLIHMAGSSKLEEWLLVKSLKDMKKWIEECRCKSLSHLSELLSRKDPCQQLHNMELKDEVDPNQEGIQVSSLSIALLVTIAQVSIPAHISGALVKTYDETFEAICFIDERIFMVSLESRLKSKLGQNVWTSRIDYSLLLARIFKGSCGTLQPQTDIDRALFIMKELKNNLPSLLDILRDEVGAITNFITRHEYSSIGDLYDYVERMFVNMIHMFLAQLPHALYKEVTESPAEEFDKRVKLALKLVCMVEVLEAQIQWSFPVGCNISSLITTQVLDSQSRSDALEEDNVDANVITHVTEDAGNNV